MTLRISGPRRVGGEVHVPGDKSLSHRAYLFGAIADGPSRIRGPLQSLDCRSTRACLEALGVQFEDHGPLDVTVHPPDQLQQPTRELDCGNSGTTMRLLTGLLAGYPITATLVGDGSLSRRPMGRVRTPLTQMGARIQGDTAPLTVHGTYPLQAIDCVSPVASAQVKSAVLLAGLRAEGVTRVTEPILSRDHTERMLRAMGLTVTSNGTTASVVGGQRPRAFAFDVPGDISSAAFWMVAAAIAGDQTLRLPSVLVNPTRAGVIEVLRRAGVEVVLENKREHLGEPVADLRVQPGASLRAFTIDPEEVPSLIDEIPVLAVLAACAEGTSTIQGAGELRVKESDRIVGVVHGLRNLGIDAEETPDGMRITGGRFEAGEVDALGDHRLAMAFAIAALTVTGEVAIHDADAIATSYPEFESHLRQVTGA